MKVEVPTAGRVFTQTCDKALALMLRAARSHLTGMPDESLKDLAAAVGQNDAAWDDAVGCSHRNRLSAFARAGLHQNGVSPPQGAEQSFHHYRTDTFRLNTRNLMTIRRVVPLIEAAGVDVAMIKGALQQQVIYGDFFAKPAGDVDLLVRERDFLQVRGILERNGYYLPRECASPWWRIFLGEQHLLTDEAALSTVDLHHRLQQPGAPSPRDLEAFIRNRRRVAVGAATIPTLDAGDALLLICMSLVKALIHREPGGGYAADLLAGLRALNAEGLQAFVRSAEAQGLRNTVRLALRGVEVLFGAAYDIGRPGEPRMLDHATDEDLLGMIVTPAAPSVVWAKRRSILWALNDAGPVTYGREVGWALGGEVTRRIFQATPTQNHARAAPSAAV